MASSPILDSGGQPMRDGMMNALTGAGTGRDPRAYNRYYFQRLGDDQINASYRSSWAMRKIIDKPAKEMVREWRDWQAEADQIKKLEVLERKLDLRNKVRRAEELRGLGGAGMVLWVNGDADPMLPINPRALKEGSLRSVHVWHRSRFTLGDMVTDPASDWYGHPSFYQLNTAGTGKVVKLHPSRVIAFRGQAVPDMAAANWQDSFWGDSIVQAVMDAVQNLDTAQNGFAALIKDARNRRVGIPNMTSMVATAEGERILSARMSAMAMGESMFGVTFFDSGSDGKSGEAIEDRQMTWAGIPEVTASYLAIVAGAGDMPATIMLGKSPDGMNATGDGDRTVWESTIKARQDLDLRPCLDQLDVVLVPSALGAPDDQVWWQFAPLSTLSEKDEAATFLSTMQAATSLQGTGAIPDIAFSKGMQNLVTERGWVPGLDAALAEIPEGERFPSLDQPDAADPSTASVPERADAPRRLAANDRKRWVLVDATPRTLYVCRKVVNVAEIAAWAKTQGITDLADDLHVTIAYSTTPVDWIKMGSDYRDADGKGGITITAGGPRVVEPLGNMAAVLLFASSDLAYRNVSMREAGASWDWPDYQPHISLTKAPVNLSVIEPYRGKIVLGPEVFEEIRTGGDDG